MFYLNINDINYDVNNDIKRMLLTHESHLSIFVMSIARAYRYQRKQLA